MPTITEQLEAVADLLYKAANGGFASAGKPLTVGQLKQLMRRARLDLLDLLDITASLEAASHSLCAECGRTVHETCRD